MFAERIAAAPEADHHLWADGWSEWKAWADVPAVAQAVQARLIVLRETPEAVAEYSGLVAQMADDGVIEPWEAKVLEKRRGELGISQATHDRLLEEHLQGARQWLTAAVDAKAMTSFRAGHSCMLRILVRNLSTEGLASTRVQVSTSSTEGLVDIDAPRLAPGADEVVQIQLKPKLVGQHELELLFSATDYYGTTKRYRSRPLVFEVARAESEQGTRVYNVDLSSMQVGKIGNLGATEAATGGLLDATQWVALSLSSLTDAEAVKWQQARQGPVQAPAPTTAKSAPASEATAPAPPAPKRAPAPEPEPEPEATWHYSGPSGQEELTADQIRAHVRAAPDEDHHVWREGYDGWRAVADVPELSAAPKLQLGQGILGDADWVCWPASVREWMCERVTADAVLVPLEQRSDPSRLLRDTTVHRLLPGVDAHALVRAGLTDGLGWRLGKLYATVDPAAFLVAGLAHLLQGFETPWPGPFGAALQSLDSPEDLEAALLYQGHEAGIVSPAARAAAASLAGAEELAERMFEGWFASAGALQDGGLVRSALHAQLRLVGESEARDTMRSVLREAAEDHDWGIDHELWMADADGLLFGDVSRAKRRLRSASCETASELVALAELEALLLGDLRAAKRTLRSAVAAVPEFDEDDPDADSCTDLIAIAVAWKTLFDDDSAARRALEAAEEAILRLSENALVGAAQLMLFNNVDAANEQVEEFDVFDAHESQDIAGRLLILFPDGPEQLMEWVEEEDPPELGLELDQAWLLAAAGCTEASKKLLERLSDDVALTDLDVVPALRWLANMPRQARSYFEEASEEATLAEEWCDLACVAVRLGAPREAARWMAKAEGGMKAADEVVMVANAWAGPLFHDGKKAVRAIRAGIDAVPMGQTQAILDHLVSLDGDRRYPKRALRELRRHSTASSSS